MAVLHDEHAKGNGDGDGAGHSDQDESEVIERGVEDFGAVLDKKIPGTHRVTPSETVRDAVKAWTSG